MRSSSQAEVSQTTRDFWTGSLGDSGVRSGARASPCRRDGLQQQQQHPTGRCRLVLVCGLLVDASCAVCVAQSGCRLCKVNAQELHLRAVKTRQTAVC